MTNEQIASQLAIAIVLNRGIDTPNQAVDEYQSMYKDILHRLNK